MLPDSLRQRLRQLDAHFNEITHRLADVQLLNDQVSWQKLVKEQAELAEIISTYHELVATEKTIQDNRELLSDPELALLAKEEILDAEATQERLEQQLRRLLLPKDPRDEKNVIVEIRGGAGGDEAALFARNLFRMYSRYAERQGYRLEVLDMNATEIGGVKEVIFGVNGRGAYSRLKYESGVHRVQRVPETEAQGRIHTSTATVAVLPEAEEVDLVINPDELRIDTYRSGGAGGQHVNKTESAVRITHLPTGIVATCQDEKSQLKNREKAMRVLRARILEQKQGELDNRLAQERRSQVGTGDRSERIRTYNFPQGRVTDHRIGLTLHRIQEILDGDLDELVDALAQTEEAERLRHLEQ